MRRQRPQAVLAHEHDSGVHWQMNLPRNIVRRDPRGASRLVRLSVAAELLGIPEAKLRYQTSLGNGPTVVRTRNSVRVRIGDLYSWDDQSHSVEIATKLEKGSNNEGVS